MVRNPLAMERVVVFRGQRPLAAGDIVVVMTPPEPGGMVVVIPPTALFCTQFGSGLHDPSAPHVKFKLPPMFVNPLIQLSTANEPLKTTVCSPGI